jgi:phosphatidylglycerol lysyltransferase
MANKRATFRRAKFVTDFGTTAAAIVVLANGFFIIAFDLIGQLTGHRTIRLNNISLDISLAIGISLIYLSSILRRRKRTAWIATIVAYSIYLGVSLEDLAERLNLHHNISAITILRNFVIPLLVLALLFINHKKYLVRSDGPGFYAAIRISIIVLAVTFIYGAIGFYMLDQDGFHQSLSFIAAMHYSIDQLGITTMKPIHGYTPQAKLFKDSLSFISIIAIVYSILSFFQPLRSRFGDQSSSRRHVGELLINQHDATSEDFFKLWPQDKQYFFDSSGSSALAYHVYRGVAVILGGPIGKSARFRQLLTEFQYICYGNDWRPAIVHCDDIYREIYEVLGYNMQRLGQEAVVDVHQFNSETIKDKYFRNIVNKFSKKNYSYELVLPPHSPQLLNQIKQISDEWLSVGGRSERGFTMGYFSEQYLNQCELVLAKDDQGVTQAFLNLIPEIYDHQEATYDLLRYSNQALGNINDFLLISLISELEIRGYKRLNLGLCPLAGINEADDNSGRKLIDSVLGFAYANGDRFYSFSGLYRFKNKYRPIWGDRYLAYQGGIGGFSRSINAVVQIMRITSKPSVINRLANRTHRS